MFVLKKMGPLLLVGFLIASTEGCGDGKNALDPDIAVQKRQLSEIYDLYSYYMKNNNKPPTDLAQLKKFDASGSFGIRAIEEGKCVVIWNVKEQDAATVLAYEKDAPTQGGAVLMADGTVKKMTADQVKAAKK